MTQPSRPMPQPNQFIRVPEAAQNLVDSVLEHFGTPEVGW